MIREICKDETFLVQKAAPATADDLATAQDLLDTLTAHHPARDRPLRGDFDIAAKEVQIWDFLKRCEIGASQRNEKHIQHNKSGNEVRSRTCFQSMISPLI